MQTNCICIQPVFLVKQNIDRLPEHLRAPAKIIHDVCQAETGAKEGKRRFIIEYFVVEGINRDCQLICMLRRGYYKQC